MYYMYHSRLGWESLASSRFWPDLWLSYWTTSSSVWERKHLRASFVLKQTYFVAYLRYALCPLYLGEVNIYICSDNVTDFSLNQLRVYRLQYERAQFDYCPLHVAAIFTDGWRPLKIIWIKLRPPKKECIVWDQDWSATKCTSDNFNRK